MPVIDENLDRYCEEHSTPPPDELLHVAEETRASTRAPGMMVGALEGRFLATLVGLVRARRVLEIGTFTGYSALCMATALPPDGRIITCEIDEHHASIAQKHFDGSPYRDRIELRLGRALDTLRILEGPFDFVFIDADKTGYRSYYEAVLPLLSETGLIAVDNVLWSGAVLRPSDDPDTRALQEFNDHVRNDSRVDCVMLTVRDGVTLIRRRTGAA